MNSRTEILLVILSWTLFVIQCSSSHGRYKESVRSRQKRMDNDDGDCIFNMCENVDNYPEDNITDIMQNYPHLRSYLDFGTPVIAPAKGYVVDSRTVGGESSSPCTSRKIEWKPKIIDDTYILNIKNFKQVITFEKCEKPKSEKSFPFIPMEGYKFECVQKFAKLKLVTYDEKDKKLKPKLFDIPINCACEYKTDMEADQEFSDYED